MRKKRLLILGGFALKGLVLFYGVAAAQTCALNIKGLQEAFTTFCSAESTCCTRPFYFNEEEVAVNFIAQTHRQCSRDHHPDKNPSPEAEEKMKQCNGGRELLEMHFSCLREDLNYRSWCLSTWPVEPYIRGCLQVLKSRPLTEVELEQKKERIQSVVTHARYGAYGL